jgi:iron complex outermembrane receptor protein
MSQTIFTLNLCRFSKSFCFLASLFLLSFSNVWTEELSSFEKRELSRLLEMDWNELANQPVSGVLGYDQEHWRNPASIAVIRPDDVFDGGHLQLVDSFRGVGGMFVTRGNAYDDFVTMRNFSGSATEKFLMLVDGREVLQPMGGTITWGTEEVPLAILGRAEIIRGPGASIWGTNAVSGVINVTTKPAESTQGNSVRIAIESTGTFLGEFVHGGKIRDGEYYRVWVRDHEYAESELLSGMPAQDEGYGRKLGFRYDKNLGMDLDLTVAGAYSTRQFEHIFDLSYRLFDANTLLPVNATGLNSIPLVAPTWEPFNTGKTISINTGQHNGFGLQLDRYQNFEELAQDAGHLRTRLSGITSHDFEWSIDALVEKYETNLGHVGHQWERDEYNLEFRGNRPIGDRNHLAFGLGYRLMEFDVSEVVTSPWDFPVFQFEAGPPVSISPLSIPGYNSYPILNYGGQDSFERFSAFAQNTFELSPNFFISFGSKFEDGDFSGRSLQPGVRASYSVNPDNLLWAAYSRAHRQASLVEKYTEVSYARFWDSTNGMWINQSFQGDPTLDDEVMDAYEIGWRSSPSEKFLWELSLFYYDTKDAVFSGPPTYEAFDYTSVGGELTFNYMPNNFWELQGSYSYSKGKKEGVRQTDFPESMASLKSVIHARDDLKFVQNFYFTGDRILPSAYNELPIDDYLRLDLGMIWQVGEGWQIGLFGQDLLDPNHPENMYTDLDVEPTRIERRFLLSISKEF